MLTPDRQRTALMAPCVPLRFLVHPESRAKKLSGLEDFSESACFHRLHSLLWTLGEAEVIALLGDEERATISEFNQVFDSLPWRVIVSHPFISELPDDDLLPLVAPGEKLLRMLETRIRIIDYPPPKKRWWVAMLKYLRIAVTALGLTACVLLVAMWVRSYWRLDILEQRTGFEAFQISSVNGRIAIGQLDPRTYVIGESYLSVAAGDAADWRKGGVLGFAYYDDGLVTALIAPHWLPALLFTALAVIPWISQRWRFSLRTLLIATALVAVGLGLIVANN
jgi:hypothetical protein